MAKRHGTMLFTLAPAAAATPGALMSNLRQHREVPMRRKQGVMSLIGSFTIAASLMFPVEANAQQRVEFIADPEEIGPFFTVGPVTVTGSDLVHISNSGLGIVGGIDFSIDPGETVSFSFASPASNVGITGCGIHNLPPEDTFITRMILEAFDASGNSLGVANVERDPSQEGVDFCPLSFSEALNVDPMSRVDFTMVEESMAIRNMTFDLDGDGDGADLDNDGLPDNADACVPTPEGQVVDAKGCSIAQICPCDKKWKNHVAYVACVARTANDFRKDGLISAREMLRIVLQAGKS